MYALESTQLSLAINLSLAGLHVAMSPNSCATFSIDENYFQSITLMQYVELGPGTSMDNCRSLSKE